MEKNQNNNRRTLFCILDFEATCDNSRKFKPMEVIEFPSVLTYINENNEVVTVDTFQVYCKPEVNPKLTKFCTELTGITQEMVDKGIKFIDALQMHQEWLKKNMKDGDNVYIVTCGDWDMMTMMRQQCKLLNIDVPTKYRTWINIKEGYKYVYHGRDDKKKSCSMMTMLTEQKIELLGRHHSGIDDCKNLVRIFVKMVNDAKDKKMEFNKKIVSLAKYFYKK